LIEAALCELVPSDEPPPQCEFHCALLSLPWALGTTLETIPAGVPYLRARADLVAAWRERLAEVPGFRIGIGWQGNPRYHGDRARSIPLRHFAPLARVNGARLISLQKEAGIEQVRIVSGQFELFELNSDFDTTAGAFMDTAAVMRSLDLVITSDSALAHLAGALGVRVWVALAKVPDWRWMLEGDASRWYPTMRLFRQSRAGDWAEVFVRIAEALEVEVSKTTRARVSR
jgi:hypothetical protein